MSYIQDFILANYNLTDTKLDKILSTAYSSKIDFADIYFEYTNIESWTIEDSIVKSGTSSIDGGVGIRSVVDDKSGLAYSNTFDYPDLIEAANMARSIIKSTENG